jgi:hypothetical protein
MTETAITRCLHHLGLTVPDLAATRAFFVETLARGMFPFTGTIEKVTCEIASK